MATDMHSSLLILVHYFIAKAFGTEIYLYWRYNHIQYYTVVSTCMSNQILTISGHPYWEATSEKFNFKSTEKEAGPSA